MLQEPIETVAHAQRRAKRRLPRAVYNSVIAGTEKGVTISENVRAFDDLGFRPRIGRPVPAERDLSSKVLGIDISMPVVISPAGTQAIHPDGEVGVAKAAAAVGTAIGLSSFASMSFKDVVAANPNAFFQLYWVGSRDEIAERAERAREDGAKALIVTLDWAFASRRDWGSPVIPEKLDLQAMIKYAPMGLSRPSWLTSFFTKGGLPDLKAPNLATSTKGVPTFTQAYIDWVQTPLPTWDDVRWLKEQWGGPFVVKGVHDVDDAKRAVDIGADAISVSNHGGNNLDGTPASIHTLPAIAKEVGEQVEVWFDGGVRRGADVVKALALGARTVLIGRAWIFGLAAGGEEGVRQVLEILRGGIDEALIGLGHRSIRDLSPDDLVVPDGFAL